MYDVLIENISLVKNYRTQFQDILNSGSSDQLIAGWSRPRRRRFDRPMGSNTSSAMPGQLCLSGVLLCSPAVPVARTSKCSHKPDASAFNGVRQGPQLQPGAITVTPYGNLRADNMLDDYDSEPIQSISDPIEPWNRFWFHFNDIFFLYVARPTYNAWEAVTRTSCALG